MSHGPHLPPPCGRFRRALRLVGWNVLLTVVGVALAALVGEVYFRLTVPFMRSFRPMEYVPNVGRLNLPNTEIRHTNRFDFWTVSRTNGLGFLDREPPSPERAAASCHVSIIGDSFVEAVEVPIEDKLQVRLEELAASRLPHLDVTTSAFGMGETSQVQQLPFYDEYARRLHPKLLVLVFVPNDFVKYAPYARGTPGGKLTAGRGSDGMLELVGSLIPYKEPLNNPDLRRPSLWESTSFDFASLRTNGTMVQGFHEWGERSWFALWLRSKRRALVRSGPDDWFPDANDLQYNRIALEQFRQRADRDGAKLVILASYTLKVQGTFLFELLSEMAATLGIPVIDQADYILRQGAKLSDARWPHDYHWSPAGHRWAAEALLEYIEENQEICDG